MNELNRNENGNKQSYITAEEREKCKNVADAYEELYAEEDVIVLDAGKYGFVKLQYYRETSGFETSATFTDSAALFEDLWEEWLDTQLLRFAKNTPMAEMDYEEIFQCLPKEKQVELLEKKKDFAQKAGIRL